MQIIRSSWSFYICWDGIFQDDFITVERPALSLSLSKNATFWDAKISQNEFIRHVLDEDKGIALN